MVEKLIMELDLLEDNATRKAYLELIVRTCNSQGLKSICASIMLEGEFIRKYYHLSVYQKIIRFYIITKYKFFNLLTKMSSKIYSDNES